MITKPQPRYWTKASVEFLSGRLGLPNNKNMQDWAYEVADPLELEKYLQLFSEVTANEDIRFTLADVIIQAFEEAEGNLERDVRWKSFLSELGKNRESHAYQFWYWSAFECDQEDAWRVSAYMRVLAGRSN